MNLRKIISVFIFVLCTGNLIAKSYEPDFDVEEFIEKTDEVNIYKNNKNYIVEPKNMDLETAIIFYPGGLVEYDSYLPLLQEIASKGILCIMPKMHRNLAIYNINSADKIINDPKYDGIKKWYIGGHSLGGAMACVYANSNEEKIEGLILLASYSTKNLKNSGLKVLSIYGSEDGVLKKDNYKKNIKNLPSDYEEFILDGGNHCGFGQYGFQKGDNPATMNPQNQKEITADYICEFCK